MKKITLYVGLNDKNTKQQKIETVEAFKIVSNLVTVFADGGTIYNATGIYKHESGEIVIENTLRVELIEIAETALEELVKALKAVLNQESVIVQRETVNTEIA